MSVDTDYKRLREVLNKFPLRGWAAEFGVYSGTSLGIIAEHMPVIGFDSFEGLPEDWREGFPKGAFALPDEDETLANWMLGISGWNKMVVKGWFEDTVPAFPFPELGLVHVDCDLYSSTVTVLNGVLDYIRSGTVFVFDEYEGVGTDGKRFDDERRAWLKFTRENDIYFDPIRWDGEEAAFVITGFGGGAR